MLTIAVDAMGGDHAPLVNVDGAVAAAREFGIQTLLVGKAAERDANRIGLCPIRRETVGGHHRKPGRAHRVGKVVGRDRTAQPQPEMIALRMGGEVEAVEQP